MPENPRLWLASASAALDAGEPVRARTGLSRTLLLDPRESAGWINLAGIALRRGEKRTAEAASRRALAASPAHPVAWNNLARALVGEGRPDALNQASRRAALLQPGDPVALMGHVLWLSETGRHQETTRAVAHGLSVLPGDPTFLSNLGATRARLGDVRGAGRAYRQALCAAPGHGSAWYNLGNLLESAGDLDASIRAHDRAVTLAPGNADHQFNRALVLLLAGRFEMGFEAFEHRWRSAAQTTRWQAPGRELWDGRRLNGETVLVWAEQGLGDTLHFSRYLGFVRDRGGVPLLEVQPELAALMRLAPLAEAVFARDRDPLPAADFHIPMMSLPRLAGSTPDRVPPALRFRALPEPRITRDAGSALNVGLVWAGNPKHRRDAERSVPLSLLAPLAAVPNLRLHVVQHGGARDQIGACGFGGCLTPHPETADLLEAAALIRGLDLLITVDTAQAHLAGTLGVETWILLPHVPDWRWLMRRADSIWYPSVRLYRQDTARAWPPVIRRVAEDLTRRAR